MADEVIAHAALTIGGEQTRERIAASSFASWSAAVDVRLVLILDAIRAVGFRAEAFFRAYSRHTVGRVRARDACFASIAGCETAAVGAALVAGLNAILTADARATDALTAEAIAVLEARAPIVAAYAYVTAAIDIRFGSVSNEVSTDRFIADVVRTTDRARAVTITFASLHGGARRTCLAAAIDIGFVCVFHRVIARWVRTRSVGSAHERVAFLVRSTRGSGSAQAARTAAIDLGFKPIQDAVIA